MPNAPIKKFRLGYLTVSIWKQEGQGGKAFHTVELTRTYKDTSGALKNTTALNQDDLLNAAKLLERAELWLAE